MPSRQLVVGGEELPGIAEELHQRIPAPRPLHHGGHLPAHGVESSLGNPLGVDVRTWRAGASVAGDAAIAGAAGRVRKNIAAASEGRRLGGMAGALCVWVLVSG